MTAYRHRQPSIKIKGYPVRKRICPTCPFRADCDFIVAESVKARIGLKMSQVCHHGAAATTRDSGQLCRGARDWQLQVLFRLGLIDADTDAAYTKASRAAMGCGELA